MAGWTSIERLLALTDDAAVVFRARARGLFVLVMLVNAASLFMCVSGALRYGLGWMVLLTPIQIGLNLLALWLVRRNQSIVAGAHLFLAGTTALIGVTIVNTGGLAGSGAPLLFAMPFCGAFLLGWTGSTIYSGASIAIALLAAGPVDRALGAGIVFDTEDLLRTTVVMCVAIACMGVAFDHLVQSLRLDARKERRLRAAAQTADSAKSQFLANMSHELRTPLNAILGYTDLIAEEFGSTNPALLADAEKISRAGRHLLGVVNDILDLAKVESGTMSFYVRDFHLSDLVDDAVAILRPLAEQNGNALAVTIDPSAPRCATDQGRLRQCLLNLGGNAVKFTRQGRVSILASGEVIDGQPWLMLEIRDTGIGMSSETVERLFKPFMQADSSTTRQFGGTGLGLVLTKRFIEAMGGSVSVESAVGVGTTFWLRAPARLPEDAGGAAGADAVAAARAA